MRFGSLSIRALAPIIVTLSISLPVVATAAPRVRCEVAALVLEQNPVQKVKIEQTHFENLLETLRSTLSGKLATIWRSEWKTKLTVESSNHYMMDLISKFETPQTQAALLEGLHVEDEGFVRKIHQRLYELQEQKLLRAEDELLVRDAPAPTGALDRTFTYYTKPIIGDVNGGKHQVRVRTYVREIVFGAMAMNEPVTAYKLDGEKISVVRTGKDAYVLSIGADASSVKMNLAELTEKFGIPAYFFAPHGRAFKLEIKTALEDQIQGGEFPLLAGPHMVEKLDVGLTMKQVSQLFAPGLTLEQSQAAIKSLKDELLASHPTLGPRIDAVLDVLSTGLKANPRFLQLEGATIYNRTAFESRSEFQTTFDRAQAVTTGTMYANGKLRTPQQALRQNRLALLDDQDARHVELKLPVTGVRSIIGIHLRGTVPELTPTTEAQNERLHEAVATYYPYVSNGDHRGKFNYTRSHTRQLSESLEPQE